MIANGNIIEKIFFLNVVDIGMENNETIYDDYLMTT